MGTEYRLRFYLPYPPSQDEWCRRQPLLQCDEMLCRGSMTLRRLRQCLRCNEDCVGELRAYDRYQAPSVADAADGREEDRSLFLIENTVFSDSIETRHELSEWLSIRRDGQGRTAAGRSKLLSILQAQLGTRPIRTMNLDATLDDLCFEPGALCLYRHAVGCEHLLFITDLKLQFFRQPVVVVGAERDDFERVSTRTGGVQRKCFLCAVAEPQWLVCEHELLPQARALLCNACHRQFSYRADDTRAAHFRAARYWPHRFETAPADQRSSQME